jgi:hypothetical protein
MMAYDVILKDNVGFGDLRWRVTAIAQLDWLPLKVIELY